MNSQNAANPPQGSPNAKGDPHPDVRRDLGTPAGVWGQHHAEHLHGEALLERLRQGWATMPRRTILALVMGGLRVRMMRSVVTMVSVVLAIAFLAYTGLSNYLYDNLAGAAERLARYSPVPSEAVSAASAEVGGLDLFSSLPADRLRRLAVAFGLNDLQTQEKERTEAKDQKRQSAVPALAAAEKALADLERDPKTLPADLDTARQRREQARQQLAQLDQRIAELSAEIDLATWLREGKDDGIQNMLPVLISRLQKAQEALLATATTPARYENYQLDRLGMLLDLAGSQTPEVRRDGPSQAVGTLRMMLGQEHQKRDAAEMVRLLRSAGISIEARRAEGGRLDMWLIVMALMTCTVGIANAMLMSVTERFREIGTMKCLGAQDGLVVKLFLLESGMLGVVGASMGIVLGLVVALVAAVLQFKGYGIRQFPIAPSQGGLVILLSVVSGMLLAVLGAFYPAMVAARMRPVDALRVDE